MNHAITPERAHRLVPLRKLIADTARVPDVEGLSVEIDCDTAERIAAAIEDAGWVRLPDITDAEDTSYWRSVTEQGLRDEIAMDLWNAAAGRHEQDRRRAESAHAVAAFSGRQP